LGLKSSEKLTLTPKVADLSIYISREQFKFEPDPQRLSVVDDLSTYARFNDEKSWVEYLLTRFLPLGSMIKLTNVHGMMKGVHTDSVYSRFEAANDGIVDIKVEEFEGEVRNRLRIRTMRNLGFDSRWHTMKINENLEVTLDK
jgi:KaiC/GvpD/RAD55 family RecA-like ATPase